MALVMLFNKIQDAADLEDFLRIPAHELDRIVSASPEHVLDVFVSVMESLCFKINAPAEERAQCVRKVRDRKMGYLFENMEKMDIQEERRKTEAARQEAETAKQGAEAAKQEAKEAAAAARKAEEEAAAMRKRAEAAEALVRQLLGKAN